MLTHHNVGSNVAAFDQLRPPAPQDVLLGILPFFHSFGYTVHPVDGADAGAEGDLPLQPAGGPQVGKLCRQHGATIMVTHAHLPPRSICGGASRRISPRWTWSSPGRRSCRRSWPTPSRSFRRPAGRRLRRHRAIAGRLRECPAQPRHRPARHRASRKAPSAGPLPGIIVKIVDLESGDDLGLDQPGMLLVTGPNVMQGYLGQPELTAEVIRDGWYVTGDVALIDADGFIRITGRISRFSKLGGEMVPHIRVEEAIREDARRSDEDELAVAVTAVPDPKKGETAGGAPHRGWPARRSRSAARWREAGCRRCGSLARQFLPGRSDPRARHRQARSAAVRELARARASSS